MSPSIVTLEQFLESIGATRSLEELERIDRRSCDCPMPYTMRKYNPYLGVWANIKLCCFVRAVERLTGEVFYEAFDFEPSPWDGDEAPPEWVAKRLRTKGLPVPM